MHFFALQQFRMSCTSFEQLISFKVWRSSGNPIYFRDCEPLTDTDSVLLSGVDVLADTGYSF